MLPLYLQDGESASRSLPVRFEVAPVVKKPGAKASEADRQKYRRQKKAKNLSVPFVALTREVQERLDQTGHSAKRLFQVGDGSFCNRTVLRENWEAQNVSVIVRCRMGVGQAPVWNAKSVSKVPALLVAMDSWLLLGGLQCDGAKRTQIYAPLPKWRRGAKRPSCLDLVTLLRKQLAEKPVVFATADAPPTYQTMVGMAAA